MKSADYFCSNRAHRQTTDKPTTWSHNIRLGGGENIVPTKWNTWKLAQSKDQKIKLQCHVVYIIHYANGYTRYSLVKRLWAH